MFYDLWSKETLFEDTFSDGPNYQIPLNIINEIIIDFKMCIRDRLDTEWRIIAKDTNYNNPYINTYTSINPIMKIMHNPDFSKKMEVTKEEAISEIKQFPWKDEFPHHHYHILELLIKCKPELFTLPLDVYKRQGLLC